MKPMDPDDFERQLSRVPFRRMPSSWRRQILAPRSSSLAEQPFRGLWNACMNLLVPVSWPSPKAWATLAAIWVFIVGVNLGLNEPVSSSATSRTVLSSQTRLALQQQRQFMAEVADLPPIQSVDKVPENKDRRSDARAVLMNS